MLRCTITRQESLLVGIIPANRSTVQNAAELTPRMHALMIRMTMTENNAKKTSSLLRRMMKGQRLSEEAQPLKAISIEELEEQAEEVDYLTPREFAKLLGIYPQQVYNHIRKGVYEAERCKCGRVVICV